MPTGTPFAGNPSEETTTGGPAMNAISKSVRLATVADLHFGPTSVGTLRPLLTQAATAADVLLLGGALTHLGLAAEAQLLVQELADVRIPIVAVLGNHDYHGDQ